MDGPPRIDSLTEIHIYHDGKRLVLDFSFPDYHELLGYEDTPITDIEYVFEYAWQQLLQKLKGPERTS
jgi:hypothetical protein